MYIKLEDLVFESKSDIIDFVTRGIIRPSKQDFDLVVDKILDPDAADNPVNMKEGIVPASERDIFVFVLKRLYRNRTKRENTALGFAAMLSIFSFIALRRN